MNPPLLPQPSAQTCPNCGAAANEGAALCPNCGTALAAARQGRGGCLIIAAQLFLGSLVLVLGLCGACAVFLGGVSLPIAGSTSGATFTEMLPYFGVGLLGLALAAACVWGIVKLGNRPK